MELINNEFYIRNLPAAQICQEFGTPLYVYDAETIKEQLQRFRRAFGPETEVKYAAKAFAAYRTSNTS